MNNSGAYVFPVLLILAAAAFATYWFSRKRTQVIVYPHQQALWFRDGLYQKTLGAGRYVYFGTRDKYEVIDVRKAAIHLAGQEIMTKDNVSIRVNVSGYYQIVDLERAVTQSEYIGGALHGPGQIAVRKAVASVTLDELLANKSQLDEAIQADLVKAGEEFGLAVSDVTILDVMLPANLKKAYSGVLEAQKEAQKKLEMARGEQAVLRSLANSAKLLDEHPSLLQVRLIQSLANGANSIVFDVDGSAKPSPNTLIKPK